jgi:hypothetical protein
VSQRRGHGEKEKKKKKEEEEEEEEEVVVKVVVVVWMKERLFLLCASRAVRGRAEGDARRSASLHPHTASSPCPPTPC